VVTAFVDDDGWDRELGLETEIVPFSKPFGPHTGNVSQGIVNRSGQPIPFAQVEIAYYNRDQQNRAPRAPMEYTMTQIKKADGNGVFIYTAPLSGWWGFGALTPAAYALPYKGKSKNA
jgi:cobalt/nickel transport protein